MYYDYQYQNTGMGKRAYIDLTGEITIDVYRDIGDELQAANIPPLQNPNPEPIPADDWARVVTCYPFFRVFEGLADKPFVSSPETRYRIGSWSLMVGNDVSVNSENEVVTFPYFSKPEFIVYERNQLRPFRFVLNKEYLASIPDEISYDPPVPPNVPAQFFYLTSFYFGSNALENGYGVALNIAEGYLCDFMYYYTWGTLQLSSDTAIPKIIFPF